MPPLNYALVVALLFQTPELRQPDDPYIAMYRWSYLTSTMRSMAISMELMDQREVRWMFNQSDQPDQLWPDVQLIRRRNRDYHAAPMIKEVVNLPPRELADEMLSFNRAFRMFLNLRLTGNLERWRKAELSAALEETDYLYEVWSCIRDAQCDTYYITIRREDLQKLREKIGIEAYQAHIFPPCVPYWRFSNLD